MDLVERIKGGLLFDGAIGTELQRKGLEAGKPPDLWNLQNPEAVKELHNAYIEAGSDAVTTNTLNVNPTALQRHKIDMSWEDLTYRGVQLAKEAASGRALVAGELGPSGCLLAPFGLALPKEIKDSFAAQSEIMDKEGVDFFIAETFFNLHEILLAAKAIRSVSKKPFILSMTFEKRKKGYFSLFGDRVGNAMQKMAESGAIAVGANCSLGSADMIEVAREARQAVSIPVIIQPNAGMPQVTSEGTIYPETPEVFAANIAQIRKLGVEIVGGCCGTTPETIAVIRAQWQ